VISRLVKVWREKTAQSGQSETKCVKKWTAMCAEVFTSWIILHNSEALGLTDIGDGKSLGPCL